MPRDPDYEFTRFTANERDFLVSKLVQHEAYKNRRFLGSGRREPCILIDDILIRNPYHEEARGGKGPAFLRPRQIMFIHVHHHLPNNEGIEDRSDHIELSHVCHRKNCINVRGRHIVAEEHWWNMWRIWCHLLIKLLFQEENDAETQRKANSERRLRSHTKSTASRCFELDKKLCDCFPHCFKHFDEDSQ